jgi:signal peptidase I
LTMAEGVESIAVALRSGSDQFLVRIPVARRGDVEVFRDRRRVGLTGVRNPFDGEAGCPRSVTLEASVFDRRLLVAIDGQLLCDPVDYDDPRVGPTAVDGPTAIDRPIALGVRGGTMVVNEFRIHRDIHYTSSLANTPRQPHAMLSAVQLGADEYFVLGDNSPVSNDSRFWSTGPVVARSLFLGKPFLVHLPGQLVPLQVFGRSVCWVPDPRRIRYIR